MARRQNDTGALLPGEGGGRLRGPRCAVVHFEPRLMLGLMPRPFPGLIAGQVFRIANQQRGKSPHRPSSA